MLYGVVKCQAFISNYKMINNLQILKHPCNYFNKLKKNVLKNHNMQYFTSTLTALTPYYCLLQSKCLWTTGNVLPLQAETRTPKGLIFGLQHRPCTSCQLKCLQHRSFNYPVVGTPRSSQMPRCEINVKVLAPRRCILSAPCVSCTVMQALQKTRGSLAMPDTVKIICV